MSVIYSNLSLDLIPEQFDRLMQQLPSSPSQRFSRIDGELFKREVENYSNFEARQVLLRMIEKNKASSQRKNWKVDETNYLLFVIDRCCLLNNRNCEQLTPIDWQFISSLVPNRDASACEFRYLALKPNNISHTPWSSAERELLLRIIQNQNSSTVNWKLISERLYELSSEKVYRTGKQCREHYTCFLRPNLKKGAWTDEQDFLLMSLFLKTGKKWSKMTKFIEGRNQNSIKNRFFLMFESKSDVRFTNSDLVKLVRRRKEKMEKKLAIAEEEKFNSELNIHLTPTNTDSSNPEYSLQEDEERPMRSTLQSEIFFNQDNDYFTKPIVKIEQHLFSNQEFERYIDL